MEAKPNDAGPHSGARTPDGGAAKPSPSDGGGFAVANSYEFHPPRKRSVTIAGHETSVSLEPMFWTELERVAAEQGKPLNALIAEIDAARLESRPTPNLTSALRQWLLRRALGGAAD